MPEPDRQKPGNKKAVRQSRAKRGDGPGLPPPTRPRALPRASIQANLDLDEYLPYLINRTGAALANAFSTELHEAGLTLPMWRVIVVLRHAGQQRQIDLSRLASIEESTMSRLITSLHRSNLVTRRRATNSNREVSVTLTARGAAVVQRLIPIAQAYEEMLTDKIDPAELEVVRRCLRLFYANVETRIRQRSETGKSGKR